MSYMHIAAVAFVCASVVHGQTSRPGKVPATESLMAQMERVMGATRPDFVVFVPKLDQAEVSQTGNEHFIVFDGPDGSLLANWTQSTREGAADQHIVFARSEDGGRTWSGPRVIAGPSRTGEGAMASWAFPLMSRSGRIYMLFSRHVGRVDTFFHTTGELAGIYSDDGGKSWSAPEAVPTARTKRDNPDASYPINMICWQKPTRLGRDGRYLGGITRWTSKGVFKNPGKSWTSHDSVVEFMRFENLDDDPAVKDLRVTFLTTDGKALTVAHPEYPKVSVCQEPATVKLPDGRLFCVMRTMAGSPYWAVSADGGETWTKPRRLLDRDGGAAMPHPLSPCPMYDLGGDAAGSGEYVLFIHGNDGHYGGATPEQTGLNRRPVYILRGHFQKDADQPVWFNAPELLMDHDGTPLGAPGTTGRLDLALYSSMTVRNGQAVLWYPDRKFFLLGRRIKANPQ